MNTDRLVRLEGTRTAISNKLVAVLLAVATLPIICGWSADASAAAKRKSRTKARKSVDPITRPDETATKIHSSAKQARQRKANRVHFETALRYLPDDCRALGRVDFTAIWRSPMGRKLTSDSSDAREDIRSRFAPLDLELDDIEHIILGAHAFADDGFSQYVAVLFCAQPFGDSGSGVAANDTQWTAERIGSQTVWVKRCEDPWAICIVEPKIVLAGCPESIRAVLRRDGMAELPTVLDRTYRLTDPSIGLAISCLPACVCDKPELLLSDIAGDLANRIEGINLEIDFHTNLSVSLAVVCQDGEAAQQLGRVATGLTSLVQMQRLGQQEPHLREMVRSVKCGVSGTQLTVSWEVPSELVKLAPVDSDRGPAPGRLFAPAVYPSPASPTPPALVPPPSTGSGAPSGYYAPAATPPPSGCNAPVARPAPYGWDPYSTPPPTATSPAYRPPGCVPAPWQPPAPLAALQVGDVIRLVEAGVDDEVIVRYMGRHCLATPLTVNDLILLTKSGANTRVITALQNISVTPTTRTPPTIRPPVAPRPPATTRPQVVPAAPKEAAQMMNSQSIFAVPSGPAVTKAEKKTQVLFAGPEGATVRWDVSEPGALDSLPLVCPGRHNFAQGRTYQLNFDTIADRPQLSVSAILEIPSASAERTIAYVACNAVPLKLSDLDIRRLMEETPVTKVVYLPGPETQGLALTGVETLCSTLLEAGADPVTQAERRGTILAILRLTGATARPQDLQGDMRKILEEWERFWFLEQPDHMTPVRVHGGII